ncbi:MAG: hypothetical protein EAZ44_06305 [Cytophagia bacterium]|nr:MAG: hypothetical protein EAY69_09395 [Cytophagales bacterium]TAG03125.1 MAG: hypothetical protein EAZ44_06305 [Cytophagia bacterium]TAG39599.1 MAG: hypothetical protein EAZ31_09020 [Cytophagia bacterium]TAH28831.1 MAG: hypothetical protein EAZ06_08775 [Cytophagales bacterium]
MCKFFLLFLIFFANNFLFAQVNIEISKIRIALNEPFSIQIESVGEPIKTYSAFPEINGFKKLKNIQKAEIGDGTGEGTKKYIVIQQYHPKTKGNFLLPSFQMNINDFTKKSESYTIIVGAKDKKKPDLEDLEEEEIKNTEYNVNADAFLGLNTDKNEIFVGESVYLYLALYISKENSAPMKFIELEKQLENIAKQLKPANAWEENFDITTIQATTVFVNGREYEQRKIFEGVYFPLNKNSFYFPALNIKVWTKNKIATNESEDEKNNFDNPAKRIEKIFTSLPKTVKVKELPPHPLRERVAVGEFVITEDYYEYKAQTGQNAKYYFRISGEGNLTAFSEPNLYAPKGLEFYPPTLQQYIIKGQGKVSGNVTFEYNVLPKQAGKYYFEDHFQWIYFNSKKLKYDTLKPKCTWEVSGINWQDKAISTTQKDFYARINQESRNFLDDNFRKNWQFTLQILIVSMFIGVVFLLYQSFFNS